jgi:two-component system sensor histidine kinase/response regulator
MPGAIGIDYAVIFNAASNGMAFTEFATGIIVDVNASWTRATGIARETAIGRTAFDLGLWVSAQAREACVAALRRDGRIVDFETLLRMKSVELPHLISAQQVETGNLHYVLWEFRNVAEAKKAEQSLRSTTEKTVALLRNASDGIHILDLDGYVVEASDSFCTMLGYPRTEAIGMNVAQWDAYFAAPELPKIVRELHARHSRTQFETRHRRKDDSVFPLWLDDRPVLFCSSRDITARKRMEDELRQSDTRFRTLFESSPDPVWLIDGHRFVECNQAAVAMLGYRSKDEFLNTHPSDFSPPFQPDGEPSFQKAERMLAMAQEQGLNRFEWLHTRPDGTTFFSEVTLSAIQLQDHPMIYCVWRDITDRKRVERELKTHQEHLEDLVAMRTTELRTSQHQLESVIEHLPAVCFIKAPDGRFLMVNRRFEEAVGVPRERAIGRTVHTLLPPEAAQVIVASDRRALEAQGPVTYEERIPYPDGEIRSHLTTKLPLRNEHGQPYALLGISTDVTPLKALQQELRLAKEEAERLTRVKSNFLANMSHEIRTPMNGILGMVSVLRRAGVDPRQSEALARIEGAGQHLLKIINDVLDLSKIEADKLSLDDTVVDVTAITASVEAMVRERAREKHLALSVEAASVPWPLTGDPTRIRQALLNYATNAIKFTESGRVVLRVRIAEELGERVLIRFEVEDTGIGIPPQTAPSLFCAFEQADNTTTRKYGGTGLGLFITRNLARLMGGDAGFSSVPGCGSTFWFTVCLRKLAAPAVAAVPPGARSAENILATDYPNRRILLVEDEPTNREIATLFLEDAGQAPEIARDGVEAVERVAQTQYDLILMDMQMPRMDGVEATRKIRAMPNGKDVAIVAMTANAFAEDRARCLAAGMDDFIAKPFEPDTLFEALLRGLQKRPVA